MKRFITAAFLLSCSVVFAQTTTVVTRKTVTGAELSRMFPKITDPKIYDKEGNVIDSVKAKQMVKSFEYTMGWGTPAGQTETKHMITKANHDQEARIDAELKKMFWPKSDKLAEGKLLDLSALAKHTNVNKLDGKAIVMLFYTGAPGYKDMYDHINDAVDNNLANNKFEVLAITGLDYENAKNAQRIVPILNAHHIVDAPDLTDFYETNGDALIVVTNAQHQITYAAKGGPAMTPRTLNKLLKEL